MFEFAVKHGFAVLVEGEFRRNGTGVDNQDVSFGGLPVDGTDYAHRMFFIICLKGSDYFPEKQKRSQSVKKVTAEWSILC